MSVTASGRRDRAALRGAVDGVGRVLHNAFRVAATCWMTAWSFVSRSPASAWAGVVVTGSQAAPRGRLEIYLLRPEVNELSCAPA